jgi:hypothetical protein
MFQYKELTHVCFIRDSYIHTIKKKIQINVTLAAACLVAYECYKTSYNDMRETLFVSGVYCKERLAHCYMLYRASET